MLRHAGRWKTLSALHFSRAELARTHDAARREPLYGHPLDTAFYTATVVNSPARVAAGIKSVRDRIVMLVQGPVRRQAEIALDTIRIRNENYRRTHPELASLPHPEEFMPRPTYFEGLMEWEAKARALGDPTTLILIDEADRLRTDSLEEVRSLFDEGGVRLVLIGMPGIEKRMARYPQLYSRIGFVHEFGPLDAAETKTLLQSHWTPRGVTLPAEPVSDDVTAAIFRITGGNFRLFSRMLTQVQRILEINGLKQLTKEVVDAARESLVIGST